MSAYDKELCERLCREAVDRPAIRAGSVVLMTQQIQDDRELLRALVEQLEAAGREIERLTRECDRHENVGKALAGSHAEIRAERDKLQAEIEAVRVAHHGARGATGARVRQARRRPHG